MKAVSEETWEVVLIVEDDSDGRALREVLRIAGARAQVDWLPAGGIGNIKRNAERLIALAKDRIDTRGCVAVVIDADRKNPSRDEPHRTIARACRRKRVPFVPAKEAIEAWFLADPGACSWLGIALRPSTDTLGDPKKIVAAAFYRTTGRPYRKRRARLELARQMTGPDRARNRSLREAADHLMRCGIIDRTG